MRIVDIISKKRDGLKNSYEEIYDLINGYLDGKIPDYQISAWLMAIYFNHLSSEERVDLTEIMLNSGEKVDLSEIKGIKIDKHSTGGVGDKLSLIILPVVACAGIKAAKLSGRGLGHTGGTIDKLESIPGFKTSLSKENFINLVKKNGLAIAGQTASVAPADKKIYSLRDVTATVDEISLIAASIMSKKLAIDTQGIVLDVKVGSGAFMKNKEDAEELALSMIDIGRKHGRKMSAVVSNMNQPLGQMVGNSLEVIEAIDTLKGVGPSDVTELAEAISSRMLYLGGFSVEQSEKKVYEIISSGAALNKFKIFVESQGGDPDIVGYPYDKLPVAEKIIEIKSEHCGYVKKIDTEKIGLASMLLGAGRAKKEDIIDSSVGLKVLKKIGDRVNLDETLVKLYINKKGYDEAEKLIHQSYEITDDKTEKEKSVIKIY
jgi:pyrimidine-nucleoside phosphorylase